MARKVRKSGRGLAVALLVLLVLPGFAAAQGSSDSGGQQGGADDAPENAFATDIDECENCKPYSSYLDREFHPLITNIAELTPGHELHLQVNAQIWRMEDRGEHTDAAKRGHWKDVTYWSGWSARDTVWFEGDFGTRQSSEPDGRRDLVQWNPGRIVIWDARDERRFNPLAVITDENVVCNGCISKARAVAVGDVLGTGSPQFVVGTREGYVYVLERQTSDFQALRCSCGQHVPGLRGIVLVETEGPYEPAAILRVGVNNAVLNRYDAVESKFSIERHFTWSPEDLDSVRSGGAPLIDRDGRESTYNFTDMGGEGRIEAIAVDMNGDGREGVLFSTQWTGNKNFVLSGMVVDSSHARDDTGCSFTCWSRLVQTTYQIWEKDSRGEWSSPTGTVPWGCEPRGGASMGRANFGTFLAVAMLAEGRNYVVCTSDSWTAATAQYAYPITTAGLGEELRLTLGGAYSNAESVDFTVIDVDHDGVDEIVGVAAQRRGQDCVPSGHLFKLKETTRRVGGQAQKTTELTITWITGIQRTVTDPQHCSARVFPYDDDNDALVVRYEGHSMLVSDPVPLAIMAAPPSVQGVSDGPGSTGFSIERSECEGGSEFQQVGAALGLGAEVKVEIATGIGVATVTNIITHKFTASFEFSHQWTQWDDICESWARAWASDTGKDTVVFRQTPIDLYEYKIVASPNGTEIGTISNINIKGRPAIEFWSIEEYNRGVAHYNTHFSSAIENGDRKASPSIPDGIFRPDIATENPHIAGDPGTYPTKGDREDILRLFAANPDGSEVAVEGNLVGSVYRSQELSVPQDGSATASMGRDQSTGKDYTWSFGGTIQAEWTIGPVVLTTAAKAGGGFSDTESETNSVTFDGSVPPIRDPDLWAAHTFRWGVFAYPAMIAGPYWLDTPPGAPPVRNPGAIVANVIHYYVDGYKGSGPVGPVESAPAPLQPIAAAHTSVRPTFQWSGVANAESYTVKVEDRGGSLYHYSTTFDTDNIVHRRLTWSEDLQVNQVYQWSVAGRDALGREGKFSDPLPFAVVTPPTHAPAWERAEIVFGPTFNGAWSVNPGFGVDQLGKDTGYQFQLASTPDFSEQSIVRDSEAGPEPTISLTDAVRQGEATFFARVRADNGAGPGPWSETTRFEVSPPPATPEPVSATAPTGEAAFPLTWARVPGAISYDVRLRPHGGNASTEAVIDATWWEPGVLAPGSYNVSVGAVDAMSPSEWSPPITFEIAPVPNVAPNLTGMGPTLPLAWAPLNDAQWYVVEASQGATFENVVERTSTTEPSWRTLSLAVGEYFVRVTGATTGGEGAASDPIAVRVTTPPLEAPMITAEGSSPLRFPVTVSPVARADGNEIEATLVDSTRRATTVALTGATWDGAGLPGGDFDLRARALAEGLAGPWSQVVRVRAFEPPAGAPVLAATVTERSLPTGDGVTTNVTLHSLPVTWAAVEGATTYDVQVSATRAFDVVLRETTATGTAYDGADLAGGEYFVRARGSNEGTPGPWSEPLAVLAESQAATPFPSSVLVMLCVGVLALAWRRRM